jgi:hypothetical protein
MEIEAGEEEAAAALGFCPSPSDILIIEMD